MSVKIENPRQKLREYEIFFNQTMEQLIIIHYFILELKKAMEKLRK